MNKEVGKWIWRSLIICLTLLFASSGSVISAAAVSATASKQPIPDQGNKSSIPGVFFYRLEPSFYTGFAPRIQEPERVSAHLGRGNQLRITAVLSDEIIDHYLEDLAVRYRTYRQLIDRGIIVLTQNRNFEAFEATIQREKILQLADQQNGINPLEYHEISIEKLESLNPGKVFHIHIDFKKRINDWSNQLAVIDSKTVSKETMLDIINDILPTRLRVSAITPAIKKKWRECIDSYAVFQKTPTAATQEAFYQAAEELFMTASGGIYPLRDGMLDFYEFTAIYPVGTLNQFAKFEGCEMPLYPCPGKRSLRTHQRTKVVDHIPEAACYSYLPWIPYMHVGKKLHNSFHSLWFNINTDNNKFIPDSWKKVTDNSRTGKPYPHLWLVSRGPMSHGCTHVNAGHISEMRQLFPSDETALRKVVTYRNKSNHFDIFDIDGDGTPEVMGVKYFYAYSLKGKKPYKMRAPSDRKSFYAWLYRKGYSYDENNRVIFDSATTSKFLGNKAVKGKTYKNIVLYEAGYSPERIQFYKYKPIEFVRELRRVAYNYPIDLKTLGLKQ